MPLWATVAIICHFQWVLDVFFPESIASLRLGAFLVCSQRLHQVRGEGIGLLGCGKQHFSSPAWGSVSEPVLFYRDFTALCSPGKLLCSELPVLSHQLCLQNYTLQLEFHLPVSACQGDIADCTMFEIQLPFLAEVKPTNSFFSAIPVFPSRLAVNVFHFPLKKQQSAASKKSRKYAAILQNTSSGNVKILQLHF